MSDPVFRALVVDDEAAVRNLTIRALQREGFSCDAAADGVAAEELIASRAYDVVVTDLKMPNRNGHVLACEVLAMEPRPLMIVLTGVLEPRLTKDLTVRGVDAIEFKPVNPQLFAAKIRALVDRRRSQIQTEATSAEASSPDHCNLRTAEEHAGPGATMIRKQDIEGKLMQLSKILPISQVALKVFNMTADETCENSQIAKVTEHDASLSLDILKLANSSYYNYSLKKVASIEEAILRIGQKRIGELALATSTMTALTSTVLPWVNSKLAWQRSVAAGVAVDLMVARMGIPETEKSLFMSAILHPLGRIALGMLYPEKYIEIYKNCREQRQSIEDQERLIFPMTPEDVLGELLTRWNISAAISEPLKNASHFYSSLLALGEPLRTKAALVKIAILTAQTVVGEWEPGDRIELPPAPLLNRLGIGSFSEIIENTRKHLDEIVSLQETAPIARNEKPQSAKSRRFAVPIAYCNLSSDPFDFLREILLQSGVALEDRPLDSIQPDEATIVNCIGCPVHRLVACLNSNSRDETMLIVTTPSQSENYSRFGQVLSLPTNYGSLQEACDQIASNAGMIASAS
jgi:HD-like signal output (HDOD) protein/DNA-binding response OmpR family regulator